VKDVITPAEISANDVPGADIGDGDEWNVVRGKTSAHKILPDREQDKDQVFAFKPKKPLYNAQQNQGNKPRSKYFKYL